jgi:hypothetical protein
MRCRRDPFGPEPSDDGAAVTRSVAALCLPVTRLGLVDAMPIEAQGGIIMGRFPHARIRAGRGAWRLIVALVAVLGLMVATAGSASASGKQRPRTWEVKPGHSIQKVVDKAKSGDTIKLKRGVYYDAVCIVRKGLTIVGAGQGKTVVKPPKGFKKTRCWETKDEVSAFAFDTPDRKAAVSHLTTKDHPGTGVITFGAKHGFQVSHHTGLGHGEYGVAAFESTGIVFTHNTEIGKGGEAGLYIGDTWNAKAYVAHNLSKGWALGVFLRDSRHGLVKDNVLHANCIGALVLDTGPNGTNAQGEVNRPAGAWTLVDNKVLYNNRFCKAEPPDVPALSGNGIVVIGADRVLVKGNKIVGHNPSKPGDIRSAGVAVLNGALAGSDAPEYIWVIGNKFKHNKLDIYWDKTGEHIVFGHNDCKTSDPAWICKPPRH